MAFQYSWNQQSQPLLETNPQLQALLAHLTQQLTGPASAPQYADSGAAFAQAAAAAQARQQQATQQMQNQAQEQAAASGKTWSSAAMGNIARAGQEGAVNLADILGRMGLEQQGLLSRQAEGRSAAEQQQQQLMTQLLSNVGGISSGQGAGDFPSYAQQRKDYLADMAQQRSWGLQDRSYGQRQGQTNQNDIYAMLQRLQGRGGRGPTQTMSPGGGFGNQGGFLAYMGQQAAPIFGYQDPNAPGYYGASQQSRQQQIQMLLQMLGGG